MGSEGNEREDENVRNDVDETRFFDSFPQIVPTPAGARVVHII
jgi:hypothetical protein